MRLRTRLLAAVTITVVLAFGGLILAFNVLLTQRLSNEANDVLQARAQAELASLVVRGRRLTVPETPDSGALDSVTWVFRNKHVLEAPRARTGTQAAALSLASGSRRTLEVANEDVRLLALPVVVHGHRLGTVVSGVSLAPYEETAHLALIASLVLSGALLLAVLLLASWMVALALRPVARMTALAADWSEHDLDRRFALGPPKDELTGLASTLDSLLARVGASLRHEQRFSAEVSHELRTPLAGLKAEGELRLKDASIGDDERSVIESMLRSAGQISRTVDALVAAAREEARTGRGTSDAFEAASRAIHACEELASRSDVVLTIERPSSPLHAAVDIDLLERMLVPVIENACNYGRSQARLEISAKDSTISFEISDDGPGAVAEEVDEIFAPGVRGTAGQGDVRGAGLGLALARRLARAIGGDIETRATTHGWFRVRVPAV